MKKSYFICSFLIFFLLYALIRYPAEMMAASTESIRIWLTKVFPSLFPFAAACSILLHIGAAEQVGQFLRPLVKLLFGLEGIAAFPFFSGILSGYPMGAKITADLCKKNLISLQEAQHILVFSNNPGPLFLVGTIGTGFFGVPLFGYLLLVCTFLGAVTTGILWRFRNKKSPSHRPFSPVSTDTPLTEALSLSVADAVHTILLIGGYLILFGAFSEALKQTSVFSLFSDLLFFLPFSADALQGFCSGLLEMTNGAYLLSLVSESLRLRLSAIGFLVSFGGFSILGQTFSILSAVPIYKKDYIKGKLCNALFSSLFCYVLFPIFEQKAQKAVPVSFIFTETAFTLSFLWLLPSLFLISVLSYAFIRNK